MGRFLTRHLPVTDCLSKRTISKRKSLLPKSAMVLIANISIAMISSTISLAMRTLIRTGQKRTCLGTTMSTRTARVRLLNPMGVVGVQVQDHLLLVEDHITVLDHLPRVEDHVTVLDHVMGVQDHVTGVPDHKRWVTVECRNTEAINLLVLEDGEEE